MLKKLLNVATSSDQRQTNRQAELYRNLIRHEAKIGGKLFGSVPKDLRREFFCLDQNTWVWHEEWTRRGQRQVKTTRYEVRPNGILKSQNGQNYQKVSLEEAQNLQQAVHAYQKHVKSELYNFI